MEKRSKGRRVALLVGVAVVAVLFAIGLLYHREIRAWYVLVTQFERLPNNDQGYAEYRHGQTGIVFVRLPGGEFDMGTTEEDAKRLIEELVSEFRLDARSRRILKERLDREQPRHKVSLSPFLVAKYEVSQSEWKKVMGSNPSLFQGENLPVEQVSWEECQEFCRRTGLSLPSEAQWEYACSAGTNTDFAFGNSLTTNQANFRLAKFGTPGGGGNTVPVDSFGPNAFGLYNMHGNVVEWCQDTGDPEFYKSPEASHKDPLSTSSAEYRIARGGHWGAMVRACRSSSRTLRLPPLRRSDSCGFRPCRRLR